MLEQAEERLFSLRAAARKHSVAVDDLAALRDAMAADLADLDAGEERLAGLEAAAQAAKAAYDEAAAHLSELRRGTAAALARAVMTELPALKLERAEFIVEMSSEPQDRTETGIDQVEFWVRTNPGTRPGPIMKVASGGELSRFLLALKVALADPAGAADFDVQLRQMENIATLIVQRGAEMGRLEPEAFQRTVEVLLSGGSAPVITADPGEAAWSHAAWEAAQAQ